MVFWRRWKGLLSGILMSVFSSLHGHANFMLILLLSPTDQVRDAGRVLREWHSGGKKEICSVIPLLWHFPSHCATCKQPDRMQHGDLFSGSVFLSAFHFHPHPHFFFLICNHSDTCLTQHSLVAERYWRSTYSALRMIYHTSPLFFPSQS